jgi:hypothetical protein
MLLVWLSGVTRRVLAAAPKGRVGRRLKENEPRGRGGLVRVLQVDDALLQIVMTEQPGLLAGAVVVTEKPEWPSIRSVTEIWSTREARAGLIAAFSSHLSVLPHPATSAGEVSGLEPDSPR